MLKIQDAGALRTIKGCKVRVGGVTRTIKKIRVQDGGTLRLVAVFADPLSLGINPSPVYAQGYNSVQNASGTAGPSGGFGPYTYSWSKVSGTTMTLSSTTSATVTFISPTMTPGQSVVATYRCTCTDDSGQTATADVIVNFQFLVPPS